MHIQVSPQLIYMSRGPLAQLLVSRAVWLKASGLLQSFAKKTLNRYLFLKFYFFFLTVPFPFRGFNHLFFVDLGSTWHVHCSGQMIQKLVFLLCLWTLGHFFLNIWSLIPIFECWPCSHGWSDGTSQQSVVLKTPVSSCGGKKCCWLSQMASLNGQALLKSSILTFCYSHLFPELLWCNGLLLCVGTVSRQDSFLLFFFGCSFQLPGLDASSLCRSMSMRRIFFASGSLKIRRKLWFHSCLVFGSLMLLPGPEGSSHVSVTFDPVSGNVDWRKKGFAHHLWGDSNRRKWNPATAWSQ